MVTPDNTHTQRAGRREWIGLAVIALPCLLYSMDLTVLNLALPQLTTDLKPGSAQLLWIVDIYGFMVAGMLITMGTLGDRIGRRKLLLIGSAAFGVASVLAAFSQSAEMLIVNRAILGIAGATLAPSTLSLIRNMFHDEKERTVAIGIWITSYSVGGAIGPLLGGVLLQFFWWGSVFLVGVPVMILLLIVAPRLLPEYKDPQAGRIDLLSVGLSLISVLSIILGLKLIAESGVHILPVISIVLGLIVGFLFIQRQKRLRDPLIDLNLFAGTSFGTLLGMNTITVLVSFGSYIFISQYLQLVLGLTPLEAGLWTLPWSVGFIAGSMLTPQISKRVKPPFIMATGLLFACAGFVVMSQVSKLELTAIVASSVLISIGLAPLFTLITDMIVGDAPPERAGAAGALSETSSEFGGALGIAIMGSIGTAIYRTQMEQAMPSAVPSHLVEASRSTLGGAITSAQTLPNDLSKALVTLSQNAFINALETLSWISAVLTVVIGLLIFLRFKGKE